MEASCKKKNVRRAKRGAKVLWMTLVSKGLCSGGCVVAIKIPATGQNEKADRNETHAKLERAIRSLFLPFPLLDQPLLESFCGFILTCHCAGCGESAWIQLEATPSVDGQHDFVVGKWGILEDCVHRNCFGIRPPRSANVGEECTHSSSRRVKAFVMEVLPTLWRTEWLLKEARWPDSCRTHRKQKGPAFLQAFVLYGGRGRN